MKGYVYFFRHVESPYVKIGYTNGESVANRFMSFKTYAPLGATIDAVIESGNAKLLETELHVKYASKRVYGEFFQMTTEEVNAIRIKHEGNELIDLRNAVEIFVSQASNDDMTRLKRLLVSFSPSAETNNSDAIQQQVLDAVSARFIGTRFTTSDVQNLLADTIDDIQDLPSLKQIGQVLKMHYRSKSFRVNGYVKKMYYTEKTTK